MPQKMGKLFYLTKKLELNTNYFKLFLTIDRLDNCFVDNFVNGLIKYERRKAYLFS